ncbi:aspartic-type endopeptidase [Yamadazyma tenuis]|uniref:Acid protease n=1 Tax=Candida tenuis (strain ATCC 10573 / BCRC 21748 / CBS 615 / JCM 9827 / NBRC 10315 / NRRL Y-1498 / VKM Y-70) TaxID=590646 RepID=G3B0Y0_CANTC|nr:acid protease [Yamadazyma tenuis ATCC 10573]XP_006685945.1 uncharacterized protein CANTEDRAFT_113597 [Yamadazyma tenuis ATCC 10573]EGV65138.1 acid protease [Yamadazyma tenuis ATCC 10573]EGV65139.1 hypothetical protein CANTEDRAFT_113597 [Yamadazyma tenuis ATCC 10573]WEJ97627.1 aspartic-type endopeptidase [Yamadazyma tenuis]
MKTAFFLCYLASYALGLHPVKDFRVSDLKVSSSKQRVVSANSNAVSYKKADDTENELSVVGSATATVVTTSSLPSSAPTIALNADVQMVFSDTTKSIYYLTSQVIDNNTNYNETFQLLLDTGSSVSWVYNESCTSDACTQQTVNKFDDFSQNLHILSDFSLTYSGQSVSGDLINGKDNDIKLVFSNFELSNFTFGIASTVPDLFDGFNVSGILGIPSSTAKGDDKNLIYQLNQGQLIDSQMFGLSLVSSNQTVEYTDDDGNVLSLPSNYGGLIVFGSKAIDDQSNFIESGSNISFTPIVENDNDYWLIDLKNIQVDNGTVVKALNSSDSSRKTIIDTGTTGFVLPLTDANTLHEKLFGSDLVTDNNGNYAFPCDAEDQKFTFTINDHDFEISVSDFKGEQYTTQGLTGNCASMIQGLNSQHWVFGAAFLSKFYTVFDLDANRIGFGDARITSYSLQQSNSAGTSAVYTGAITNSSVSSTSTRSGSSIVSTSSSSISSHSHSNNSTSSTDDDNESHNSGAVVAYSGLTLLMSLISHIVL